MFILMSAANVALTRRGAPTRATVGAIKRPKRAAGWPVNKSSPRNPRGPVLISESGAAEIAGHLLKSVFEDVDFFWSEPG
jgi:hypothetical protein